MPTHVALHLGCLTCGAENEHGPEPYIWPLMIADETGIPFIRTPTPEWAAKVLASEMTAGQSIPIPDGMDGTLSRRPRRRSRPAWPASRPTAP